MTEKLPSLSTQTATPNQSLPPLNPPLLPPTPSAISTTTPVLPPPSSAATVSTSDSTTEKVALAPPAQHAIAPKVEPAVEEEPYTIKCICGYQVDDGSTIYCDLCDSWQHIECFYPNNSEEATREEFAHSCHECKPRPLNVAHAIEFQRQRINAATAQAVPIQKPKRPPSKSHQSHKKKTKSTTDLTINGHAVTAGDHGDDASHPAHSPAKRSRNGHRASHSVSARSKRSPSYSVSRTPFQHAHPLSPATTPPDLPDGTEIHNYSSDFLTLCNDQDAVQNVQTNSFASLAVSNTTSIWLREHARMLRETGHTFSDVFQTLPSDFEPLKRSPRVEVEKRIVDTDTVVRWRYLVTPVAVDKDVPLMELNGQVGFQKDYCAVPANRYDELSCPLPFVFFHPMLPLYIDTRREGSLARYVRRSCRPNAVLDTYLSGGSEYHFWLVSDRHIAADEQITIPWDFRLPHDAKARILRLLGLGDDDRKAGSNDVDIEEEEFISIARWVYLILSEYGGCACNLGSECAFARFHRTYSNRTQQLRNGVSGGAVSAPPKKKGSRKTKSHAALSPTSTGHATNSRAASEGRLDDFPENDKMSTSSRSKPPSRDMTPAPRQGSFDTPGILTEPTDRDKRKVAMVEDTFRRLEQQPPRKKKRTSDGTGVSERSSVSGKSKSKGPSSVHAEFSSNSASGRHYVDASTSRSKSGSPVTSASPQTPFAVGSYGFAASASALSRRTSAGPPPVYSDASVQTDPTEGEWYSTTPPAPSPRRRVVSLSRRLLNRYQKRSIKKEQPSEEMHVDSSSGQDTHKSPDEAADVAMTDAPPAVASEPFPNVTIKPLPSPIEPSTQLPVVAKKALPDGGAGMNANQAENPSTTPTIKRSPDLRVQLPKIPAFSDAVMPSGASTATPLSASSIVQSPFSVTQSGPFSPAAGVNGAAVATPSPVKKKMSLSDYMSKSRKAAASRPAVKPPTANADDAKTPASPDGHADDSPTISSKAAEASPATTTTGPTTVTSS